MRSGLLRACKATAGSLLRRLEATRQWRELQASLDEDTDTKNERHGGYIGLYRGEHVPGSAGHGLPDDVVSPAEVLEALMLSAPPAASPHGAPPGAFGGRAPGSGATGGGALLPALLPPGREAELRAELGTRCLGGGVAAGEGSSMVALLGRRHVSRLRTYPAPTEAPAPAGKPNAAGGAPRSHVHVRA